jgi:zinc/manganese transport system ATP-binding protein
MTAATSDRPRTGGIASGPEILSLRDASLSFGSRTLWSHLNLRVRPGEFVAVLGPNGAGKTSLLRAVLGALPLSAGLIELLGAPVRRGHGLVG